MVARHVRYRYEAYEIGHLKVETRLKIPKLALEEGVAFQKEPILEV